MFSIYADDVCIYNDILTHDQLKLIGPKLTLADCSAGSLTMTVPPKNIGYSTIKELVTTITVKKDGEEIWEGRPLTENGDFWNNRILYCEGALAYFNDSTQPPGEHAGVTIRNYLETLIAVHNSKVASNRKFEIGVVTVVDDSFPTYYTNDEKTIEILNSLVETYGGHLRVRKENGVRYVDYLKDYPDTCSQIIQFGSNLLDFTKNWDLTEYATVILPLGARQDDGPIEALDSYVSIESVNGGSRYLQSKEAVATYGWIEKKVSFDGVTEPSELLKKAQEYLKDIQFDSLKMELSALDLHYLDANVEAVKLLDTIRVISHPHGLDRLFPVTKLEIPLDSPEQTSFTLGDAEEVSLTSVNNQTNSEILNKIEQIPKANSFLKEAKQYATDIMHMATTGYITITQDEHGSETLYITNTRDYLASDKMWKWNMNGLGYSKDGGKTFGLAITMDGAIVADYITAGVLNGNVIRTGVIQDYGSNVVIDLVNGTLTMKKGSINIGDGNFTVDNEGNVYAKRGTFAGTLSGAKGTFGGQLVAASGEFTGTVRAKDFILDSTGESVLTSSGYLNGKYIADKTITAAKLEVKDLVSIQATIGGWTIKETEGLVYDNGTRCAGIRPNNNDSVIYIGTRDNKNVDWKYPLLITADGRLYAEGAYIAGEVHATSGEFTGEVHATSGEFNSVTIDGNSKFKGTLDNANGSIKGANIYGGAYHDSNGYVNLTLDPYSYSGVNSAGLALKTSGGTEIFKLRPIIGADSYDHVTYVGGALDLYGKEAIRLENSMATGGNSRIYIGNILPSIEVLVSKPYLTGGTTINGDATVQFSTVTFLNSTVDFSGATVKGLKIA